MKKPHWVSLEFVIAVHNAALSRFGGTPGIRKMNMLESAFSRPEQLFHYENANHYQLAAAYAYGVVKNHPFIDGNKRTAFLAAAFFLEKNGHYLQAPEVEAVTHTLGLAASAITQDDYAQWLERSCQPASS